MLNNPLLWVSPLVPINMPCPKGLKNEKTAIWHTSSEFIRTKLSASDQKRIEMGYLLSFGLAKRSTENAYIFI
jgi:hypothetical protein